MNGTLKKYSERLIDFILPPRCILSGEIVDKNGTLHSSKWKELNFISTPLCSTCGTPFEYLETDMSICARCLTSSPSYNKARSAIYYDDNSRDFVLKFKHGDKTNLSVSMVPMMLKAGRELFIDADYLIPVPLHRWRLLKRRYNQASILAKSISKETGIKFLPDTLTRHRYTKNQGAVSGKKRIKNVKNAFTVKKNDISLIKGKNLILIDDVFTTGATVNECAKTLIESGASKVDVLTLSMVVKNI